MEAPSTCNSSPSTVHRRNRQPDLPAGPLGPLQDLTELYEFLAADRGLIRDLAAGKLL